MTVKDHGVALNVRMPLRKGLRWALAAQDPATFEILHIVRDLTDEERASYQVAESRLWRHLRHQRVLELVRLNHQEFVTTLTDYAERTAQQPLRTLDLATSVELEVNRIVMNYLAMVRAFLDYSETSLKRDYGRDSQPVQAFKSACTEAFDTQFAYRFIYKLRDFALHCGPPVDQVATFTRWDPSAGRVVERQLRALCNRDRLLEEFGKKWGRIVLHDLQESDAGLEIGPLLKGMLDCLETINAGVTESQRQELQHSATIIADLVDPACAEGATPCFVPSDQKTFRLGSVWQDLLPLERVASLLPDAGRADADPKP